MVINLLYHPFFFIKCPKSLIVPKKFYEVAFIFEGRRKIYSLEKIKNFKLLFKPKNSNNSHNVARPKI